MSSPELATIYNFLALSDQLGTSGQPTTAQFGSVQAEGYEVVINLALGTTPRDLPNEAEVLAGHGIDYVHIPVVWDNPTASDLEQFFQAMDENQDKKCYVHCIANMRVSAFMLLYRVLRQGMPVEEARASMDQIWQPNETWQAFIESSLAAG